MSKPNRPKSHPKNPPRVRDLPPLYRLLRWQRRASEIEVPLGRASTMRYRLVGGLRDPITEILSASGLRVVRNWKSERIVLGFSVPMADKLIADWVSRSDQLLALPQVFSEPPATIPERLEWRVFQIADHQAVIRGLSCNREKEFQATVMPLVQNPIRALPAATFDHVGRIRALQRHFPNFKAAIDRIAQQLSLSARLKGPVTVPKLLVHGEPGTGKTEFVRRIAEALDMHFVPISLPQVTAGWQLSGLAQSWNGGKPGQIVETILKCPLGKVPLIFFDEICKVAGAIQSPVEPVLLQCLEPATADRFHDEYLGFPVDLRPIGMVFAANRLTTLRPETLDRLEPVAVRAPTPEEMPEVVKSVDAGIRGREPDLDQLFEPLDSDVLYELAQFRPREVRKILQHAYAKVAEGAPPELERLTVSPADIQKVIGSGNDEIRNSPGDPINREHQRRKAAVTVIDALVADALRRWVPRSTH